jgi:uncharacterized protein (TIGR00730 family)
MAWGRVTVFGSSRITPEEPAYQDAVRLGRLLAQGGYTVCSGGYAGLMEAVSRGAAEAGGRVVGITVEPWASRLRPNSWVGEEIVTPHLFERLVRLTESDAYIALPGGAGTLGEVALVWNLFQTESIPRRPLILVGARWRQLIRCLQAGLHVEASDLELLQFAGSVDEVLPLLPAPSAGQGRDLGR